MDVYLGAVFLFAGNFAPRGFALCNGQLLPISSNTALFSLLGTTYGGDGVTTFGLPDLRGRVPIHPGQGPGLSPYVAGQNGGTESVTLLTTQMPAHTHSVNASERAGTADPAGAVPAQDTTNQTPVYASTSDGTVMNPGMIGPAGGNQPHPNLQPFLCINFIIATQGIYPSRN